MLSEAQIERIIDQRVQHRLAIDAAYQNAANAQEQAEREEQVTAEEERVFRSML